MSMSDQTRPQPDPSTWVDEHGDLLYRFALLRVKDPHVAEDLVQETLISALEGIDGFRGGSAVRTWLVGILKHKIYDYFRKSSREVATSDLSGRNEETDAGMVDRLLRAAGRQQQWHEDPDKLVENNAFWEAFSSCLAALPENARRAFAMRELDDLATEEICKILGITSTNLWVILHRARARLRDCLDTTWFEGGRSGAGRR